MTNSKPTLYFGYGSNLWLHQMSTRCPESQYLGIARLNGYKWLINERGYANVVEDTSSTSTSASASEAAYVYGLVYSLSPTDEARLDKNEGVPIAYTKEYLPCDFWSVDSASASASPSPSPSSTITTTTYPPKIDPSLPPSQTSKPLLVYIDRQRVSPSTPRHEYVYRMNRGIEDALACGVPEEYVRDVMRVYIPSDDDDEDEDEGKGGEGKEREKMAEYAREQAAAFRDESGVIE
ncbi:uncharacterized protein yc1106_01954 [Curvularia clavata]|uniref:gamma-glutamylcyclotransferase n=1 Tax=Curvularia clavata TaxID=95742 RepID=A0A9Q9DQ25_CURCL|nr:uncharacterized protein yc1106_01954 [Curvularia clavata]